MESLRALGLASQDLQEEEANVVQYEIYGEPGGVPPRACACVYSMPSMQARPTDLAQTSQGTVTVPEHAQFGKQYWNCVCSD